MKWLNNIIFYFPIRLFVTHFKTNILLIVSWFILLFMIFGKVLSSYGANYLFLNPEYLGTTSYFSFQLLGVCFGIFFISWNIVSYLLLSYRYPFVASMKWPLAMYTFNNSIIPIIFIAFYLYKIYMFQTIEMYATAFDLFLYFIGMVAGFSLVLFISAIYFMATNKNIFGYLDIKTKQAFKKDNELWINLSGNGLADRIDYYLTRKFRIRHIRDTTHYSEELLKKVYRQHHLNAFLLIILNLVLLVGLGYVIDKPIFEIPAAGSIFLFFSVLISIFSLVYYWAEEWGNFAFVFFLIIINFISGFDAFHYDNQAYGLDYTSKKAIYHLDSLEQICSAENMAIDKENTLNILNKWKEKNKKDKHLFYKPKLLIVLSSGGGSRSSAFTMKVMQTADSLTNGKLMQNTMLMSGASGGMIGLAYFRELYLRTQLGICEDIYSSRYQDNISKDMLNKIWASVVTNDIYYPIQMREINGYTYRLDRGMMMENALNENTEYFLDKPLKSYQKFEKSALIPLTILASACVSDSRKMLISSQNISFMMKSEKENNKIAYEIDAIDFKRFFDKNNADNLRYSSALRMNASYPFVLPSVSLPSKPKIDVIDAGIVDNFGIDVSVRFLSVFKDWINKNTSGVVIVQIRDNLKNNKIEDYEYVKMFAKLFGSFSSISENITERQDYEHDYMINATNEILNNKLEIIRFEYNPSEKEKKASLSFHITNKELKNIQKSAVNESNMKSYKRLVQILKE